VEAGLLVPDVRDLRDYTTDRHKSTDDAPFGGGPGMVMLAEPIFTAVEALRGEHGADLPLILTSPAGEPFTHAIAQELAAREGLIVLCGRYEGVDQRVVDHLVDRQLSLGDFVLSGGELAAMCVIDAVARQLPGVVGNEESLPQESFAAGLLDWPHYTRPEVFRGLRVPEVLLSGNHAKIIGFRQEEALLLTYRNRPDLLDQAQLQLARQLLEKRRQEEQRDADAD